MTKQEIGEVLEAYKSQISFLKEELIQARAREEKLTNQVEKLQDGVMAVRAPEAYRDMRADEREVTITADQAEFQKKAYQIRRIRESYIQSIEGNALKTGEDLDAMMESVITRGHVMQSKSPHQNSES